MENKKTLVEFIKENRGKIVKGGLIIIGLVAGVVIVKKLNQGEGEFLEAMENLNPDEFGRLDGMGDIVEQASEVVEAVVE